MQLLCGPGGNHKHMKYLLEYSNESPSGKLQRQQLSASGKAMTLVSGRSPQSPQWDRTQFT